ncbi:hypothetical protein Tco_0369176 [Tanacetum coccineum]
MERMVHLPRIVGVVLPLFSAPAGCKVMRTLASVEIDIMLILGFPCRLSSSNVRCLGCDVYLVFIDPESSTQADGAQSSRVPVPLPEDPYESSPFVSPPDLPLRNRYRGTFELVEDSEEDEEIEESMDSDSVSEYAEDQDPTIEGIRILLRRTRVLLRVSRAPATPFVGTAVSAPLRLGYGALRHRELALEEDDVYSTFEVGQGSRSALESERPERVSAFRQPTLTTWTNPEDGMVYIDVPTYPPPAPPVQTPPSPEWTSGSLPISPSHSDVPSPILLHIIPLTIPSHVATPTVRKFGFLGIILCFFNLFSICLGHISIFFITFLDSSKSAFVISTSSSFCTRILYL